MANFNDTENGNNYIYGVPTSVPSGLPALTSGDGYTTYFAAASTAIPDVSQWSSSSNTLVVDWPNQPAPPLSGDTTLYAPAGATQPPYYTNNTTGAPGGVAAPPVNLSLCTPATVQTSTVPTCPGPGQPTQAQGWFAAASTPPPASWNLIDGYLRVDYKDANGNWQPVTREWLGLGFARGSNPPTAPFGSGSGTNPINPKAILIFQQPADRNGDGSLDTTGAAPYYTTSSCGSHCTRYTPYPGKPPEVIPDADTHDWRFGHQSATAQSASMDNWYPINFYDPREGEVRDNVTTQTAGSCAVNGVMNAVELDVGNLELWLAGTTGSSGTSVDFAADNGYILYFSDRRGMLPNPTAGYKTGDSGLEDTANLGSGTAGTPDGSLESPGGDASPEDVNLNGVLDAYGARNLGLGFGNDTAGVLTRDDINSNPSRLNPYKRIPNCIAKGRKNWVSGARHVLRLVDGSLGHVPTQPGGTGGFTVASENPVYVLGDYNANSSEQSVWTTETTPPTGEAAAGIIADSVTLLSNNWVSGGDYQDFANPFGNPSYSGSNSTRPNPTATYYRVAIAAGKNRTFSCPSWSQTGLLYGFGTDGGVHNFLRFLEDWNSSVPLYYKGSLVSLYYSTYNTGTFKCCGDTVYHPPDRHFVFDSLFSQPQNLPPGTPMFRDVDNLSYRQDLTPR